MLVWSETESVCHVATSFWCDLEEEEQRESLFKTVSDNSYCQDQQVFFCLFLFSNTLGPFTLNYRCW